MVRKQPSQPRWGSEGAPPAAEGGAKRSGVAAEDGFATEATLRLAALATGEGNRSGSCKLQKLKGFSTQEV